MNTATDSTRLRAQMAVMSIFRSLGVPAGEPLSMGELSRHWGDYGVRATDLDGALDDLARKGLVLRHPETPDQIAKTVAGEQWLGEQPAWVEYQLLMPRASRVAFLRQDGDRRPAPARRRRRDDAPFKRGTA